MSEPRTEPSAGWYDDPDNPGVIARWWTGTEWTEARRPVPQPQTDVAGGVLAGLVNFVMLGAMVVLIVVVLYLAHR